MRLDFTERDFCENTTCSIGRLKSLCLSHTLKQLDIGLSLRELLEFQLTLNNLRQRANVSLGQITTKLRLLVQYLLNTAILFKRNDRVPIGNIAKSLGVIADRRCTLR